LTNRTFKIPKRQLNKNEKFTPKKTLKKERREYFLNIYYDLKNSIDFGITFNKESFWHCWKNYRPSKLKHVSFLFSLGALIRCNCTKLFKNNYWSLPTKRSWKFSQNKNLLIKEIFCDLTMHLYYISILYIKKITSFSSFGLTFLFLKMPSTFNTNNTCNKKIKINLNIKIKV